MDFTRFSLVLVAFLGAIIGSFLNVVIYRLPRGLSVTNPRWSFCPHCHHRIRWYDNVPILGWLLLRGRCRDCHSLIPAIYPLIECLSLLLFITVWDAMFGAQMVPGVKFLAADWPSAAAYLILFGGLLAGAAMDIESYIIDIRICLLIMAAGVVAQGLRWGLPVQAGAARVEELPAVLPPALSLLGVAMGGAWLVTILIAGWLNPRRGTAGNDRTPEVAEKQERPDLPQTPSPGESSPRSDGRFRPFPIIALSALTVAILIWQLAASDSGVVGRIPPGGQRGFAACFVFMLVLVLASMVPRQADTQIVEEIEAERAGARAVAVHELVWFIPSILIGVGLLLFLRRTGHLDSDWRGVLQALFGDHRWASFLAGGFQALAAGLLAAGIGWCVRILGTLTFGKEAFGTGDIYIMAAIAAVAGLPLLILAFFLGALLALVGVLATLFHKTSRAIPFGPWLAIGSLVALWLQPVLVEFFEPAATMLWAVLSGRSGGWSFGG
ncbi:MAG TPA: A24 family peptidase [Phycisphaerae bacterium]|nr:A24 family peptidase [Phycisphaerae bacterium]